MATQLLRHEEALNKLSAYQLEAVQVLQFAALAEKMDGELTFSADAAAAAAGAAAAGAAAGAGQGPGAAPAEWPQAPPPLALHQAQPDSAAGVAICEMVAELASPLWLEEDPELAELLRPSGEQPDAPQLLLQDSGPLGAVPHSSFAEQHAQQPPAAPAPAASDSQPSSSGSDQSPDRFFLEQMLQPLGMQSLWDSHAPRLPTWLLR